MLKLLQHFALLFASVPIFVYQLFFLHLYVFFII